MTTGARLETHTRARVHAALGDPSRLHILEILEEADAPFDVRELASRVGLHVNTVRSHLRLLAEAGLVSAKRERGARSGRPRVLYEVEREAGTAEEIRGYRLLAEILAGSLTSSDDAAGRAEQAGEAWGRYLVERPAPLRPVSRREAIEELLRLNSELDFQPALSSSEAGDDIVFHRCPFSELAQVYQGIVCSAHLGLMQGVLAELRAGVVVGGLEPFVEPGVCVAHLAKSRT